MNDVVPAFKRPSDLVNLRCTDDELMQGVVDYLCGVVSAKQLAERFGYGGSKVESGWKLVNKTGWLTLCQQAKDLVREIALGKISNLSHRAYDALADRLENGDPLVNETGEEVGRVPIKAKDLSLIVSQLSSTAAEIEKRLSGVPTDDKAVSMNDLVAALELIAQRNQGKVIEAERV